MLLLQSCELLLTQLLVQMMADVRPIPPRKGESLRILDGNEAGNEGTLSSIADHEGVVKLADNALRQQEDVVVVNMISLGRLVSR